MHYFICYSSSMFNSHFERSRSNARTKTQMVLYFLIHFYWLHELDESTITKFLKKKHEDYPSLFSYDLCLDAANYLFSVIHILGSIDNEFSMGRIGTVASEHMFSLLRYESGKEQTTHAIKNGFNKIVLCNKLGFYFAKIRQRSFSSATVESKCFPLQPEIIELCMYTAKKICLDAGVKFTRDSAYYDLFEIDELLNEEGERFYHNEISILKSEFMLKQKKNISVQWRMQASQMRFSSKTGRNITSRYVTGLKEYN